VIAATLAHNNMATVAIKIKIMPEGLETNLAAIKDEAKIKLAKEKGVLVNSEEQPIAFGLKALIVTLAWPEEKDSEIVETIFKSIQGVSQVDIIDYRRAIG
jgi:elongation factor 1-beta